MSSIALTDKDSLTAESGEGAIDARPSKIQRSQLSTSKEPSTIPGISSNRKPKRNLPPTRPAIFPQDVSPSRSSASSLVSTKAPQASSLTSASQLTLEQPRPQRPLLNSQQLLNSGHVGFERIAPSISRSPAPSLRKNIESPINQAVVPARTFREGSVQIENPDDKNLPNGMRTPRSNSITALATVVESSLPLTPSISTTKTLSEQVAALVARHPNKPLDEEDNRIALGTKTTRKGRTGSVASSIAPRSEAASESESGYKSEDKTPTSSVTKGPPKSFARRPTVVSKDTKSRGMTVETETVSSVPQIPLGTVGPPGGASIRSKKSTDTIKAPKKDRRKNHRRPVVSSTSNVSSKADIFAAKIAEAVDEANSSDSEETFVYESNPPESAQRPSSRFHSRTPSATSIGPDLRGQRLPLLSAIDGPLSSSRKGMKFVNNSLNKEGSNLGTDGMSGDLVMIERGASSSRDMLSHRDRRGGRHQTGHRSILADDNPFHRSTTQGSMVSSRHSSRPPSPKLPTFRNGGNIMTSKRPVRVWASYEADIEGGDDEHTPLIRTRIHRCRRPGSSSLRQLEHTQLRRRGCVKTYAGCIVTLVAIVMILTGIVSFLIATTNALIGVKIVNVADVLVSKQEIMLDLIVEAINPNAIAVTVGSMDVKLFARSAHIHDGGQENTNEDYDGNWNTFARNLDIVEAPLVAGKATGQSRKHASRKQTNERRYSRLEFNTKENVDEGTDPPEDLPGSTKETMLLGRIFSFDSVLTFEGTPFRRIPTKSIGELQLSKPGNKTEEGGSERWERILLHPFELIVRGVLKYQLPLSGKIRTAPISGSVTIHPDNTNS